LEVRDDKMDIMTITDDAKRAVADLCNKAILVEYDIIFGYPKIIDHMANFEKLEDKQLLHDVEILGKDSLGHYKTMDILITRLGYEPVWQAGVLPRIVGVVDVMENQLDKEKFAIATYTEARKIVLNYKKKVRVRNIFGKIIRVRDGIGEDLLTADEIVNSLNILIADEVRHARLVEDSIATLNMYLRKKRG